MKRENLNVIATRAEHSEVLTMTNKPLSKDDVMIYLDCPNDEVYVEVKAVRISSLVSSLAWAKSWREDGGIGTTCQRCGLDKMTFKKGKEALCKDCLLTRAFGQATEGDENVKG